MRSFEAIVLGLGAMGSAAVYHLAKRGRRVLGIDQFSPPHAFGSSHGDTRITRLAIGEGVHYTPLAMRSHELWRELERETGATLLTTNGGLVISSAAKSSVNHVENFFQNTVDAAVRFRIPHEMLDAREIRRRYPPFNVGEDEVAYFEPSAGFLRPEACVNAHLTIAEERGAEIRRLERVLGFEASDTAVEITTDRATYAGEQLIVAVGAWAPKFFPPVITRCLRIVRQTLLWFDIDGDHERFLPQNFPIFIWELQGRSQGLYGFPSLDGAAGGIKVGTEQYAQTTTAETIERVVGEHEKSLTYERYIAPFLPSLGRKCVRATTCLYTVTPDSGFIIDRHPDSERVWLVSPCSGHGFKHSAAIGEALSALVSGGTTPFDLSAFRVDRLGGA